MSEHEPARRCILTGEHDGRTGLVRLALSPEGVVLPDLEARAPGRGAWVRPDFALIDAAQRSGKLKRALARAFRTGEARAPDGLAAAIAEGLKRRALDRLGLEKRAGHLILGTARIEEAVTGGRVLLLVSAADAAADGREKLRWQLARRSPGSRGLVLPVGRLEMSLALGRENVVHAALCDRPAAERVAAAVERWRAFCGTSEEVVPLPV